MVVEDKLGVGLPLIELARFFVDLRRRTASSWVILMAMATPDVNIVPRNRREGQQGLSVLKSTTYVGLFMG